MTKAMCLVVMTLITYGLFAQADVVQRATKKAPFKKEVVADTYGSAPAVHKTAYNNTPFNFLRGETSEALITFNTDLNHFVLNNPANTTPYGVSAPEFLNCAEYYEGQYYFATSTSGKFGTIDPVSGAITEIISSGAPYTGIAYNPADGQMYTISLGNAAVLYTIDVATGAHTQVSTVTSAHFVLGMTISNDGRFFLINAEIDGISELNPTTGEIINSWPAGFTVNYGQDMACDRETNTIYWAAYNASAGAAQLYTFNPEGGTYTLVGIFSNQASGFAIQTEANMNMAAAPTNFTATPDPTQGLSCQLSWTNPSTTIGGTALSAIQQIIVKRNGEQVMSFSNPTVGGDLTWTDENIPAAGTYAYSVYAVTSEGNGASAGAIAVVGAMCTFTVYGHDAWGDGWNGAAGINFLDSENNVLAFFTVSGQETTQEYTMPSGITINCVWVPGTWDEEVDAITITDQNGVILYEATSAPSGNFFTFTNSCSQEVPNPPTNFVVTPDPDNGLSATLTWTNPSTCLNGSALTMISATVLRNGEVVHTINNPVNGANETYVDNVPVAANYTYSVYVTNEAGNSGSVSASVGVGGIYQMVFGETVEITTCSGIIFDNGGPTGNYLSNSNDIMIIHPATAGASIAITGNYVIETNYDKLYVYDGVGTAGNLLNTYSSSNGGTIEDVATTGALTLHFTSDYSVQKSGFEINISCVTQTAVSGTVTNLATGDPIEGAVVSFAGVGVFSATTDASGNYSTEILSGIFDITVNADGYNTIIEEGFEIPEGGVTGKNFAMTSPTIAVAPTTITMSCGFMGEARENVTITNSGNGPLSWKFKRVVVPPADGANNRDPWDLIGTFTAQDGGMQAVATDGEYIYLASWQAAPAAGHTFEKYTLDLTFVEGFDIAGVSGVRDLTYDGQYFYCGTSSPTLYCLDLANKALVSSTTTGVAAIRHCSYDPVNDGFWVGNWDDLNLIDRTGAILLTAAAPSSAYGSGYDDVTEGGPYLLLFSQPASNAVVYRYNIATNAIEADPIFDFAATPGFEAGSSGGAFVGEYQGSICFFGNVQQSPNLIGIYELGVSGVSPTWLSCDPSSGVVEAGQTATVQLVGDGWVGVGTYTGSCLFESKNPNVGDVQVDVTFTVIESNCEPATNLTATYGATYQDVVLNWDAPTTPGTYTYNIYASATSQTILVSGITETTYTFTGLPVGTHTFVVRTVCDDGGVSSQTTNQVEIETNYCNPEDMCDIIINMADGYGDGWNGAKLNILVDGNLFGTATLASGSTGTATINICPGTVELVWVQGQWDGECSFVVLTPWGFEIFSASAPQAGVLYTYENTCETPPAITVSGTITKLAGGAAIANATVQFAGAMGTSATTDANGQYTLSVLQDFEYVITVSADGYNTITETYTTPTAATATKDYTMTSPTIAVAPTAVTITAPYMGTGSATVTVSNSGNGPLTYVVNTEYTDAAALSGISYAEYLRLAGNLPTNNATATYGKAPQMTPAYVYNPLSSRDENSNAIAAIAGQELHHFLLGNPASTTPFGTGPEFMNTAEYVDGTYYFATSSSGLFGTIDAETGTVTTIASGVPYAGIAYNAADGQMYGISLGDAPVLYTVNMETGAATQVVACEGGQFILGMTINNDGRFFVINAGIDGVSEINPTTGAFINNWPAGFTVNYGQDMACDRTENEIYWAAFNADAGAAQLYHVNVDNGTLTLIGTFADQASCFAIEGSSGWLTATPGTAVVNAGATETVTLTGNGSFNQPGTYHAIAHFTSKNPNVGTVDVDVTFIIEEPACGTPENLAAEGNQDEATITITWDAVPDALSYNISINGTIAVEGLTATTKTFEQIEYGVEYCYRVQAVCAAGAGLLCNPVCITVEAPQICHAPTNLVATANLNTNAIDLTWTAPTRRDVLLTENFDSGTLPTGWTVIDNDGDGHNWKADNPFDGHSGKCIASASYINGTGALTPDNYLITPLVEGAGVVNYFIAAQDAAWPAEHYGVYASSTGTNVADFTVVFEETMTAKGVRATDAPRGSRAQGTWYERTVNLPAGTKYIAFRHFDCSDYFWLNLDDVTVSGAVVMLYNVYRDGVKIASNVEGEGYEDAAVQQNTEYCYTVTHVCSFGESEASNQDCETLTNAIDEVDATYQVFPNPANNKVTVKGENIARIVVYNVLGQVMETINVTNSISDINTSSYENGVYVLRITTANGDVTTQRVIIAH